MFKVLMLDHTWWRCRVHFMCNALACAGKHGKRLVPAVITAASAKMPERQHVNRPGFPGGSNL